MLSLNGLAVGDRARVVGFSPMSVAYRRRLLAMGLTPNTSFEVIRRMPLGDPIVIRVRGAQLCVRQQEADAIFLESIDD